MRSWLHQLRRRLFPIEPSLSADCGKEDKASIFPTSTFDQLLAKGLAYAMAGDHADALRHFEQAIEIDPRSPTAYCHAGASAFEVGVLDAAQDYFNLAIHYDSRNSDATLGLARVLRAVGQIDRATKLLHGLTADFPERGEVWYELACCQHARSDFKHAAESLQRNLKFRPNAASSLNLLGLIVAREFGQLKQGEELVRRALQSCPGLAAALSNLGWILTEQGRLEEGLDCFDQVLTSIPNDEETRLMRAYANLKHGNFDAGWQDYSARHASPLAAKTGFKLPELSLQSSLVGKRVLVYAEQGLGDQIMFASCIPDILKRGGHCVLECDYRLVALFRRSFPECQVFSRSFVGMPGEFSIEPRNFDGQLAMGSLPAMFRRGLEAFPLHNGYLRPDPDKVLRWRKRLVDMGSGPYIGISWRGGAQSTRRQLRSIPLPQWKSILNQPAKFISLQYGECKEDLAWAEEAGLGIHHWPQAIEDYDETAALVAALDLVISVCTAVVHLGGALGKPVWVLTPAIPEWRYLSQGEQLPWYPSIRLFRQRPESNWSEVIATVAQTLNSDFPN